MGLSCRELLVVYLIKIQFDWVSGNFDYFASNLWEQLILRISWSKMVDIARREIFMRIMISAMLIGSCVAVLCRCRLFFYFMLEIMLSPFPRNIWLSIWSFVEANFSKNIQPTDINFITYCPMLSSFMTWTRLVISMWKIRKCCI